MDKDFETLEILLKAKQVCDVSCMEMCNNCQKHSAYNTINQALNELQAIKEAKSSEALETLGFMGGYIIPTANGNKYLKDFCDKEFVILKQALQKTQEQEKVLEIIFKKRIDIFDFIRDCIEGERTDYEWYEMHYRKYSLEKLTQEEFDLLKRGLEKCH